MSYSSCKNLVETACPLSVALSYVPVCLSLPLFLCLPLFLFLFVRVADILLMAEQGRGLPRTLYIYECNGVGMYVMEWDAPM